MKRIKLILLAIGTCLTMLGMSGFLLGETAFAVVCISFVFSGIFLMLFGCIQRKRRCKDARAAGVC